MAYSAPPAQPAPILLSLDGLAHFGLGAIFPSSASSHTGRDERVNALSFSDCGRRLVSTHNDGVIKVFSGETGVKDTEVYSRGYGCRLATHTHHELCVLHAAATKPGDVNIGQIAYHSLHDNKVGEAREVSLAERADVGEGANSEWNAEGLVWR